MNRDRDNDVESHRHTPPRMISRADSSPESLGRLQTPVGDRDHTEGAADAPITLVEYGDYQCPYCGQAHPVVKELQRRLGMRLRFVFRNFPLTQLHPDALHAAEAAESVAGDARRDDRNDALAREIEALRQEDK